MKEITLDELAERARTGYFYGQGRIEAWDKVHHSARDDWRRVVQIVIAGSLDLPEQMFRDFADLQERDMVAVKEAAKEGASEAITEAIEEAK